MPYKSLSHFDFLRFEDANSNRKDIYMDAEYFSGHHELLLRTDLLNLHVYICAPEVLMLFSDNFDYQVLLKLISILLLCSM